MVKIAVCDDERLYLDLISEMINKAADKMGVPIELKVYKRGQLLIHEHEKDPYDVLFLDIDMPEINGFDIAQRIKVDSMRPFIVFITSKISMVYESFNYRPFGFIRKDNETLESDIASTLDSLFRYYKQDKVVKISNEYTEAYVELKTVMYIQNERHYLTYITTDKNEIEPIKERDTISNKEKELSTYDFAKPHARFLVNLAYVKDLCLYNNTILMSNGESIPISRNCKDTFMDAYRRYMRK